MASQPQTVIKICGIKDRAHVTASAQAGAAMIGLMFYPTSPRALTPDEGHDLRQAIPPTVAAVGVFVDADDAWIAQTAKTVGLDMVQLHGSETPDRVATIRRLTGLPVIKALGIASVSDLERASAFEAVADYLLFDAQPSAVLPGGNGVAFDWTLLQGRRWSKPWLLSGGLHAKNVARAIALTDAPGVDVSSGVETTRGIKDEQKIHAFIQAVRGEGTTL